MNKTALALFCVSSLQIQAVERKELWQANLDASWLAASVGVALGGQWMSMSLPEKKAGVAANSLAWDKSWVGTQNSNAVLWSNILVGMGAPIFLDAKLFGHSWNRTWQEALIYTEVLSFNSGLNLAFRSLSFWPRPEYHSADFDLNSAAPSVMGSFYSGHASASFALATAWYLLRKDRGDSPILPYLGFVGATAISALRVAGGKHYPSDVVVGALVGTGLGYLLTQRHLKSATQNQVEIYLPLYVAYHF